MKKTTIFFALFFCVFFISAQTIQRYAMNFENVAQFEPPIPNISYLVRDLKPLAGMPMTAEPSLVITNEEGRIKYFTSSRINPSLQLGGALFQPVRLQPDGSLTCGIVSFDNAGQVVLYGLARFDSSGVSMVDPTPEFEIHSYVEDVDSNRYYATTIVIEDVDYSSTSGIASDTNVKLLSHKLVMARADGSLVYEFAFDDLSLLNEVSIELIMDGDRTDPGVIYDVTHPNYVSFAEDSHIIFSNRHSVQPDLGQGWTGIGVIDMQTDSLKWVGWGHEIALDQPVDIVMQHDFKMIEQGPYQGYYSVYNNGDSVSGLFNQPSSVLVLDIDFTQDSAWVIDYIEFPDIYSNSMGNVVYEQDRILVNHGATFAILHGLPQINVTVHDYNGNLLSQHSLPDGVFSYNIESAPAITTQARVVCDSNMVVGAAPFVWSNSDTGSVSVSTLDSGYVIAEHAPGFMREVVYFSCEKEDTTSLAAMRTNQYALRLYPNPTHGKVYVENFKNNQIYVMHDIAGKVVTQGLLQRTLDVSRLNPGIYFLETEDETFKLVKQ